MMIIIIMIIIITLITMMIMAIKFETWIVSDLDLFRIANASAWEGLNYRHLMCNNVTLSHESKRSVAYSKSV